ncbi:hypothetical protein FS842_009295 [Serendipita sp. 407]|nr:hypothetical protein FS842_009295 [Serendipita sp. 407]
MTHLRPQGPIPPHLCARASWGRKCVTLSVIMWLWPKLAGRWGGEWARWFGVWTLPQINMRPNDMSRDETLPIFQFQDALLIIMDDLSNCTPLPNNADVQGFIIRLSLFISHLCFGKYTTPRAQYTYQPPSSHSPVLFARESSYGRGFTPPSKLWPVNRFVCFHTPRESVTQRHSLRAQCRVFPRLSTANMAYPVPFHMFDLTQTRRASILSIEVAPLAFSTAYPWYSSSMGYAECRYLA